MKSPPRNGQYMDVAGNASLEARNRLQLSRKDVYKRKQVSSKKEQ